jgi:hypothetical protein
MMMKTKTPTEPTIEAKTAINLAFERLGGVAGMVTWAKNHRALFYNLYVKLIPMTVTAQVNATVDKGEDIDVTLRRIVNGLIEARQDGSQGIADDEPLNIHRVADVLSPIELRAVRASRACGPKVGTS